MTTSRDIKDEVMLILEESEGAYDVDAIVDTLVANWDLTGEHPVLPVSELGNQFWSVVERYVHD